MKTIQMLQSEGVRVEVSKLDVAVRSEAEELIGSCERLAPIGAIFHLAMILEDRLILKHVRLHPPKATNVSKIFSKHSVATLEDCLMHHAQSVAFLRSQP